MRSRKAHGFTLVELMIVVGIIGILAAIAIPAFTRYIRKSRSAEAAGQLNKMWAGSLTYYTADFMTPTGPAAKQFPGPGASFERPAIDCCSAPGARCAGGSPVWSSDGVWLALKFSIPDAHSFIPGYSSTGDGTNAKFTAITYGDTNCNNIPSEFRRDGYVTPTGDVAGQTQAITVNEFE